MLAQMVMEELMVRYPCVKASRTFPDRYYVDPLVDANGRYSQPVESIKTLDTVIVIGAAKDKVVFDLNDPNSVQEFHAEFERRLASKRRSHEVCW